MFNIYILIYIIVAVFIIGFGSKKLNETGKSTTTMIFFVGSMLIFIIFGIKWFGPNSLFSKTPVSWPPTINTCPDYLTYYQRDTNGEKKDTCIDTIGVSKNGALAIFPKDSVPTGDNYYFSLETKSSDPAGRITELCQRAIYFGVTWEGITNGESCITTNGLPMSPGSPGYYGSDNCPP
jgi:hypothetical protein